MLKIIFSIFSIASLIITSIVSYIDIKEYNFVQDQIENGLISAASGEVNNFRFAGGANDRYESFEVNGVKFRYHWISNKIGYHSLCKEGGVICGNGQKVRILYYSKNEENLMLKIDELASSELNKDK